MKEKKTEPFINIGTGENVYRFIFIAIIEVCLYARYFSDVEIKSTFKQKCLLELIKRRSKVYEKNVSHERALNLDK